jgi:ubiquinone/menaquinone biosynthesis C-methylase UbiE
MTETTTTAADHWSAVSAAWDTTVADVDEHTAEATRAFVDAAAIAPGDAVLELAAGPGTLGETWSALAGPDGRVVLSDVAPGMVEVARRRNGALPNVDVALVDLSAIDAADASFDVVVCRMGLMFAQEPAGALREIRRVLRPGGRFAALTWGALEHNPWMSCVGMAAMANGLVAGGPPVAPGEVFSLGDPEQLSALVAAAGFDDVSVTAIDATFHAASIDDHVDRVSALAGPLAAAFATADDATLAAVHRTAAQLAEPFSSEDGVSLPGLALLVRGHA